MKVDWKRNDKKRFAGRIQVTLLNEAGALAALTTIIAQQAGNISYMQISKRTSDFFTLLLDVDVANLSQLKSIIVVVRTNQYVESVERVMI
ncbi:MAG: GTP pyrophosphokinase rsh [SAR116 cluster bacterium]|nr:MAG: GTP pyrophosphokinase rsh [SAR116 cluster bacterium]